MSDKVFEHIVENSSEIMMISDDKGMIRYANKASSKIYGVTSSLLVNQPLNVVFTSGTSSQDSSPPSLLSLPLIAHLAKTAETLTMVIHTHNNDTLEAEMRVSPIFWQGEPCFLVVLHDINSVKKIARTLEPIGFKKVRLFLNGDPTYISFNRPLFVLACAIEKILACRPFTFAKVHLVGVYEK